MKTKMLAAILERVETWPPQAQDALAEMALDLEAGLTGDDYALNADELAGIDRGLHAAAEGRFATEEQVEAVLAKLRGE